VRVRPLPTIALGAVGGLIVGMTSVGSGSLIIIGLMLLYPGLTASRLVGTDLMQAVPLVASAALGHLMFGQLDLAVSLPLIIGSVPGAFIGAQLSARLPGGTVRRVLAFVLFASGLKLLGVPDLPTAILLIVALVCGPLLWAYIRHAKGFPALASVEIRRYRVEKRRREAALTGIQGTPDSPPQPGEPLRPGDES
jgi:hypothetical protein